ncbi:MAG: serpin family protein [bacterium]
MRLRRPLPASCLLALAVLACPADAAERNPVVDANNAFALDLYARLCAAQDGDLFFSPFSISTALGMTYAGARGQTAAQMADTLGFAVPAERVHPAFRQLLDALAEGAKSGDYQLRVANALWGQEGYGFLDPFLELTRTHYGAGLRQVDFRADAEAARQVINRWVAERTEERIRELFPPGVLTSLTRLVLANAIYFKGQWARPFDPERTREEPFTLASGRKVAVPMMHQTARFAYAERPGLQVLGLPYEGGDLAMFVLLPAEPDGLAALERGLSGESLGETLGEARRREVVVALPKFRLTSRFGLAATLAAMGMERAFTDRADFSGINGRRDLFLQAVVHKAFVEVNEEGTEAAAATGVAVGVTSVAPRPKPVFRADHPFLFLIRHRPTGAVLFLGRLARPAE